jgi:3-deoxy-D-manno-octulosonate 8-phosphate phosphatase (KDO 8-P phosphatase)
MCEFDLSQIHTVVFDFDGVFTNNKVIVNQDGSESVICDRADGLAFDFVRYYLKHYSLNMDFFILSKEKNLVVNKRAEKIGVPVKQGISDKLKFIDFYFAENKKIHLDNPYSGLVYVGNDLNDYFVMKKAQYSIAPSDAHPRIKEIASLVLPQKGGEGFVRAFIEQFFSINSLCEEELYELISNC